MFLRGLTKIVTGHEFKFLIMGVSKSLYNIKIFLHVILEVYFILYVGNFKGF